MNSSGPHNAAPDEGADDEGVPWWILGVGLAALIFTIVVGVRVAGVLAALVFPPAPPVPTAAQQVDHTTEVHGTDSWTYTLPPQPCDVVTFYAEAGLCEVQPGHCDNDAAPRQSALAAVCSGERPFSRFVMAWEAKIYAYPDETRIDLSREIPWTRTAR